MDEISVAHVVRSWWLIALRGVAAVVFGVLVIGYPGLGLEGLAALFSVFALVYGALTIGTVFFRRKDEPDWVPALVGGALSVVAGIVGFAVPRFDGLSLLLLISAWLFVVGVAEIVDAARLRRTIENEWLLGLSGGLSVAVGLMLSMFPAPDALRVGVCVGAWALAAGTIALVLGFRLRSWGRQHHIPGAT